MRGNFRRMLNAAALAGPSLLGGAGAALPAVVIAENGAASELPGQSVASGASMSEYPANAPCEDRHVVTSGDNIVFAAVMDGHGGWQAAEFAKNNLWKNIRGEMTGRPLVSNSGVPKSSAVVESMIRGYERTDRDFMTAIRPAFDIGFGEVSRVGCCAVSAIIAEGFIAVANAGDCRAVVGRQGGAQPAGGDAPHPLSASGAVGPGSAGGWTAVCLSEDHNCRHESIQEELREAHPGEDDIVVCRSTTSCYVKGRLQPTRALGDLYLKYSEFNGRPGTRLFGRHIKPPYTPPYVTATPQVQLHTTDGSTDAFLLLACDGVWDVLSNEEAVEFIANDSGDPMTVSERLVQFVLEREGASKGLTIDQLKAIRPGRVRRSMHDDMTAIVVWLDTAAGKQQVEKRHQRHSTGVQGSSWSWWPFSSVKAEPTARSRQPAPSPAAETARSFCSSHPASGAFESSGEQQTQVRH